MIFSARISFTFNAMAGAADNPGDLIPATSIKPGIFLFSPMIKSSLSDSALRPENCLICSR